MLWNSVELINYLPFSHVGNKRVKIDFVEPCCAFLGNNGSGKSSLLRAMTPYSPVRTDYGSGGKIIKTITHDGHLFVLTSDFSNTSAPHSFKKDDVELNLSGTTETQKDLIEENFGITKLIDDILTGDVRICSMSKAERKSLFSSTYPGDLSFVLEYHKKICSQIRACSNQLKLLKAREASLRGSLIDDAEREKLKRFQTAATELITRIDKCVLLLSEENKRYQTGPKWTDSLDGDYTGWNMLDVRDEILCLGQDILRSFRKYDLRKKLKPNYSHFDLEYLVAQHRMTAKNARIRIEQATTQVESVRDELNKFVACREANKSASEKTQLEERFKVCQEELDSVVRELGVNVVTMDPSQVDCVEERLLPYVKTWVEAFHPSSGLVKTQDEVMSLGVKLEHARLAIQNELTSELASVSSELITIKDKLDKLTSKPYPKDCNQICPLRSAVEDNIHSTETRFNSLVERKKQLMDQVNELKTFVEQNASIYSEQCQLQKNIEELRFNLREHNLESIVFAGEDPIQCCHDHCFSILNRLIDCIKNTRLLSRKQALTNEMEGIRSTLTTLANTKQLQVSEEIIESTIKDREEKLNLGIQELNELEALAQREESITEDLDKTSLNYKRLERFVHDSGCLLNQERVDATVKFNTLLIDDFESAKKDLQEELYCVNKTLIDQQKHMDILESEIIPTANKIEHDKLVYEAVADGLSPTSGLPCIYLTRFINRLISRANQIIADVWFYNLELVYLEEGKDLDFTIQVLIRNSTTVKDLSMLSMGQKAIVDLAMTLAICIERGYLDKFSLKLDECDAALSEDHRTRLVCMLSNLIDAGTIKQMFLVNHFAIQTGMSRCDSVVLSPDGVVVPDVYNQHAEIE